MFSCYCPTYFYTQLQDLSTKGFCSLKFARLRSIVKNQWVQVTVSRVKHIRDPQAIGTREFGYSSNYTTQLLPGNNERSESFIEWYQVSSPPEV